MLNWWDRNKCSANWLLAHLHRPGAVSFVRLGVVGIHMDLS